jgi:HD-GYP domain-containing protein (c-di-GMP phosphodiesterase class II)
MDGVPRQEAQSAGIEFHLCRGDLLAALARVLDYTPSGDIPHHARVAVLAARMASRLHRIDRLDTFYAGLVHDIGLMEEPRDYSRLWDLEEQANRPLTRSHPLAGAQMIGAIPELLSVAEIILDHHEWVNGHGYPRGKSGDEIATAAQVVRFADTCDILLREQGSPELIPFLDAVRSRTAPQVSPPVADTGLEVLGESGFYAQLLTTEDVNFLVQSAVRPLAANDLAATEAEVAGILELFANVADAHASDKIGHSRRVSGLAVLLASAMGVGSTEMTHIKWAALLHDIGMVAVPKTLLDKPGMLTDDELAEVRHLAVKTEEFLRPVPGLEAVTAIAASHGEAFDGGGYPHGLMGHEIPVGARIIAVCDTFDALTSRRPYREARDTALAIDILVRGSGSVFDPNIVSVAVPMFLVRKIAEQPLITQA